MDHHGCRSVRFRELVQVVSLLAAGVVAVALFKRLGLGSVLGYLLAGLAIGPFGLGLLRHAPATLHVAELGVVMVLFIHRPGDGAVPRLWGMRLAIFGLASPRSAPASRPSRWSGSPRAFPPPRPSSPAPASC